MASVYFQTIYFTKVSESLNQRMGGKIIFQDMYLSIFSGLIINNLYIEDERQDTLLYAKHVEVKLNDFNISDLKVEINSVNLEDAYYNLYSINEREQTNMQYIIDYFKPNSKDDRDKVVFRLNADNINVSNLRFKYHRFVIDTVEYGVNFDDIEIYKLNLQAENFKLINDSMSLDLSKLSLVEKSGLEVNNIKGFTIISPTEISLRNLVAKTPHSHLFANKFSMNYSNWHDMSDFLNKVKFDVSLQLSAVNIGDIGYFASFFKNMNIPTFAKGRVYGPISNIRSKRFQVDLGKASHIETSFTLQGLPDINETFLSLDFNRLRLNMNDLEHILNLQKDSSVTKLPLLIKRLEEINYKGNITGFLTDLVAYGEFNNKNGQLNTDIRYKYNTKQKDFLFSGAIQTQDLDLSVLNLSDTLFDKISMQVDIFAQIDSLNQIKGNVKGDISSLGLKHYNYKNIRIEAELDKKILASNILVNDTNIYLNLSSKIDFSLKHPYFDIKTELRDVKLARLNWINRDITSSLSLKADAQFSNFNLEDFFGEFVVDSLFYREKEKFIYAERINLFSRKDEKKRIIDVNSDLFDAHFEGNYLIRDLIKNSNYYGSQLLPALIHKEENQKLIEQKIDYRIFLKQTLSTFKIFSPDYVFSDSTLILGSYNSKKDKFLLSINSDYCYLVDRYFKNPKLDITLNSEELNSSFKADHIRVSKELSFDYVDMQNHLKSDSLSFNIKWSDKDNLKEQDAEIAAEINFFPSNLDSISVDVNMIPSFISIQDTVWYINDAIFKFRGNQTSVSNFILNQNKQYLFADGTWQKNTDDTLKISFKQINLSYFPIIEQYTKLKMEALSEGDIALSYYKDKPIINGYIQLSDYKINDKLLGDIFLNADWDNSKERLNLSLVNKLGVKDFESINCNGFVDIRNSSLGLNLNLNKQKLDFFEPFIDDYVSKISGLLSGKLSIKGPYSKLDYTGELDFSRASFKYDYLGGEYNFSHKLSIKDNRFNFNKLKLFDIDGNGDFAEIDGYILHQNLRDFQFFLNANLTNFNVLNTKESDNSLYYGLAYITGVGQVRGTPKQLKIDMSARTNTNTYFNIPLSDAEEAAGSDFISFTTANITIENDTIEDYTLDLSGVELNFDIEVTPEAEIQIIFDETLGDIIKTKGSGDLNLKINTLGEFGISGSYEIEKGDYLFTLRNVINKRFKIAKGSSIKWNGDPYLAYVDIDAVYHLKTPIYDLTLDPEDKERIPVQCHLHMKESLQNPDIEFDIKLPSSGDKAKSLISSMDEDEKNKQLLSLLVLSKFYTPEYLQGGEKTGSGNIAGKNASELLSNQLSSWLSQMSDDFDIGVNYRPGDEITNDEIELALSTELFNDRVSIDGNVGYGNYKRTNSNVVGNVSVSVKVNKKGNVRLRGFNRVNDNEIESTSLYTQGVGLFYREDFDSFGALLRKYWNTITPESNKDSIPKTKE